MLWYKGQDGEPIYTYDAREARGSGAHWSETSPRGFGNRARFVTNVVPAFLLVTGVEDIDKGRYRCRVDFRSSQTRNSLVQLSILNPPQKVRIRIYYHFTLIP